MKTLTIRVDEQTYGTFVKAARAERRSIGNLIEIAALRYIHDSNFASNAEMAEIRSRPELMRRMKAGSADAKRRRGRFVPDL